jgi:DMSO/TMAO reductase YedYZ heme-binding membrane subunit
MNISDAMVSQDKLDIEVFSSGFEKTLQDNGIFISLLISILLIILSLTEFHISNKELEIIKQIRY